MFFKLLGCHVPGCASTMCSIWAKETIRASRGRRVARRHRDEEDNVGSVSVVSRWRLIAAAAASALPCSRLRPRPAAAKASLCTTPLGAPIAGKSGPFSRATTSDTASSTRRPRKSKPIMLRRFGDTAVPRTLIGGVACRGRRRGADQAALPLVPAPYDAAASLSSSTWRGNTRLRRRQLGSRLEPPHRSELREIARVLRHAKLIEQLGRALQA